MKIVYVVTIIVVFILGLFVVRLLSDEDTWICTESGWIQHGAPKAPMPTEPCEKAELLGGDKDEYGCIGSAGYQWCKEKQKCLRVWEEDCSNLPPLEKKGVQDIPLSEAFTRITKKPFGMYIDPKTSPVQPERFSGFHTGTDFEVFPQELNDQMGVRSICDGIIIRKEFIGGYGGVIVQECKYDQQPITVLYGHLSLNSSSVYVGDNLSRGDSLGFLGKNASKDTDGERKHLHLGIHKGATVDVRGYVKAQQQLDEWIDTEQYLAQLEN